MGIKDVPARLCNLERQEKLGLLLHRLCAGSTVLGIGRSMSGLGDSLGHLSVFSLPSGNCSWTI